MATYLTESLSCAVCLELFDRPKVLLCGHSLCLQCVAMLEKKARDKGVFASGARQVVIDCPHCRKPTALAGDASELLTNYQLMAAVQKFALLDKRAHYRSCAVCRDERAERGVLYYIGAFVGRLKMLSRRHRQKQETMARLHAVHTDMEADIERAHAGHAAIVDALHRLVHTLQCRARADFDAAVGRLDGCGSAAPDDDTVALALADGSLARESNGILCELVAETQAQVLQTLVDLDASLQSGTGLVSPPPPVGKTAGHFSSDEQSSSKSP